MKTNFSKIVLLLAAISIGLTAGIFFAWAASVVPGLGKLNDLAYLEAMQSINREIQNPFFFSCFIGAVFLLPLATFMVYSAPVIKRFWLLLAASFIYIIGVFGVTVAFNVPLNNMLEAIDLKAADAFQLAAARETFEPKWNFFNLVRAWLSALALILTISAMVSDD